MTVWYRTIWHDSSAVKYGGPAVETVDVERASATSVWIAGRRKSKRSEYENFFETEADARKFIAHSQQERMDYHLKRAEDHKVNMEKFGA